MTKTPFRAAGLAAPQFHTPVSSGRVSRSAGRPQRNQPLMRKYEVVHLRPNGDINDFTQIAPAHPAFENSFGAIARGGILKTENGPMAIEDIYPGDRVLTKTHGFQTVQWRGGMSMVPSAPDDQTSHPARKNTTLIRISADAFGQGRPMPDLLLGPAARLYHRTPQLQSRTGHTAAFVPALDFLDGINIVEVHPQTSVQTYQLGFERHERICVNGVDLDSQNPGARHELGLRGEMLDLYLTLFPHVTSIEDFGMLLHPRLSLRDLDLDVVA